MILVRIVRGALDDTAQPFVAVVRIEEEGATCVHCRTSIAPGQLAAFHDRKGLAHLRRACPLRGASGTV